jgi:hypothetical protein
MHAYLFHIYNHAFTLFALNYCLFSRIGHDHVRATLFEQRPIIRHAYVIYSAKSFFMFNSSRMIFELLIDDR